MTYFKM